MELQKYLPKDLCNIVNDYVENKQMNIVLNELKYWKVICRYDHYDWFPFGWKLFNSRDKITNKIHTFKRNNRPEFETYWKIVSEIDDNIQYQF